MLLEAVEGRKAKAVIESTGNLWIRLYLCLEETGVEVILANPEKTKAIAEARLKSDKMDVSTLADLLREVWWPPVMFLPVRIRAASQPHKAQDKPCQRQDKGKEPCSCPP